MQLNWIGEFQQHFCGILMKKNIFAWKECMNVKVTFVRVKLKNTMASCLSISFKSADETFGLLVGFFR